ncbi:MAG: TolC family protein [Planctomycetes bacterium]|nr:TolC family protein [Planctomycetota bacterium]
MRRPRLPALRALAGGAVVGALGCISSCTAGSYHDDADRDVDSILREFDQKALADRAGRIVMPVAPPPEPEPALAPDAEADPALAPVAPPLAAPPLVLDLKKTLEIAITSSRDYISRKESLYLSGLGFTLSRFNYGPQYSAAVNHVWGDADGSPAGSSVGGSFGVSQLLPTNGTLGLSTGFGKTMNRDDRGDIDDWSTSTGINFSQPLLRGAGYDLYRESLTQAERSMVYTVRAFELFRQDFTIDTASQFFQLVSQKRQLANLELDLAIAANDQDRTTALHSVDRATQDEVVQTRRRRLTAESQVTNERVAFQRAVERFLIELGLDPRTPVELVESDPEFESIAFTKESAIAAAMANRLDVQTERDSIEDAERGFRLARNNLLPDLNVSASYGSGGAGRGGVGNALPDSWSRSASVSLDIPLQTIDRRNAWRQAEISIDQTRRGWLEFIDNLETDIEAQLRELTTTERQLEIAQESLADEEEATYRLELKMESGDASTRDLIEARQQKLSSENSLIEQRVNHFIQRLRLYRSLGILFIDQHGGWSIGAPAAGAAGEAR